jgi:hypothetical protein
MSEETHKSFKERLVEELRAYAVLTAYFIVFLSAFTTYRRLVLKEYQVGYVEYGFSVIEGLILGKLILIGRALHVGERFGRRPLIIPALYKTFCFGVLVVLFNILEHAVVGLFHVECVHAIVERILSIGKWEILARLLVMITALGPLFATSEIGNYLGKGRLFQLFFERQDGPVSSESMR